MTSRLLELVFHIKVLKQVHKELIVIDAVCIHGSPNRIRPRESCLVFVRNTRARNAIRQALFEQEDSPQKWKPEDNTYLILHTDGTRATERNRKGVKLVECDNVVRIFSGTREALEASLRTTTLQGSCEEKDEQTYDSTIHSKKERHSIFASWLVETYGVDALSSGSGVLDVAGGNGELSRSLSEMGVPSVLLDPDARCYDDVSFSIVRQALYADGSDLTSRQDREGNLVRTCALVAGMHPDQATEPIVDMALRLGVPFAVLPCCVMPALFPHRKQKCGGDPVRSYKAFCQYLLDKATPERVTFQVAHLPFVGRNKVIYLKNDG